jgi:hypothetical protein
MFYNIREEADESTNHKLIDCTHLCILSVLTLRAFDFPSTSEVRTDSFNYAFRL